MKTFQPKVLAVAIFFAGLAACKSSSQHLDVTIHDAPESTRARYEALDASVSSVSSSRK